MDFLKLRMPGATHLSSAVLQGRAPTSTITPLEADKAKSKRAKKRRMARLMLRLKRMLDSWQMSEKVVRLS